MRKFAWRRSAVALVMAHCGGALEGCSLKREKQPSCTAIRWAFRFDYFFVFLVFFFPFYSCFQTCASLGNSSMFELLAGLSHDVNLGVSAGLSLPSCDCWGVCGTLGSSGPGARLALGLGRK